MKQDAARRASQRVRYFGCHVSASGGLENALRNGTELEVNTIQLHASPPQRWNIKPFAEGIEKQFLEMRSSSVVEKVFFHGIYLINLATPNPSHLDWSKKSLVNSLELLARIRGDGVIFHLGSLKNQSDEERAYEQVADALNWVLAHTPEHARLILEVTAGSGHVIGDRIEELAAIYNRIERQSRVGFALDSQHLWASGYDLVGELEAVLYNVEQTLTLEKVWAIHLNDSKTEKGSKKDRHENFGEGMIGNEALSRFFLHQKLSDIPFILETPAMKQIDTAKIEVAKLKKLSGIDRKKIVNV